MQLTIQRETLLKPLQSILGVVEKKQTKPILSNVLISVRDQVLKLTVTDLELEMVASIAIERQATDGEITVPARKLADIFRSLADDAVVDLILNDKLQVVITSGKARFSLASLPVADFPNIEAALAEQHLSLSQQQLSHVLNRTYFAMAHQDVRYFLNGMLFDIQSDHFKAVATDGHRLALSQIELEKHQVSPSQIIVPRKAILELMRLLDDSDQTVTLIFGHNHLRIELPGFIFTTKLLDGRYPDYKRVIPAKAKNVMIADRGLLKQTLSRTAILSNEKYRGVRLEIEPGLLKLSANNPEQEQASDEISMDYHGDQMEIGFNVSYLLDVVNAVDGETIELALANANSSALMQSPNDDSSVYVVMPIKL